MSRWKYKTEKVTVGDNSQDVRGMTAGERKEFADASQEIKAGKRLRTELPFVIAALGCTPKMSEEELKDMPPELLDKVVSKIMLLSGFKDDEKKIDETTLETPAESLPKFDLPPEVTPTPTEAQPSS